VSNCVDGGVDGGSGVLFGGLPGGALYALEMGFRFDRLGNGGGRRTLLNFVELRGIGELRVALEGVGDVFEHGEMPLVVAVAILGSIEDAEGGAEADSRWGGVVLEDFAKGVEGEGFELAHFVEHALMALALELRHGGTEEGLVLEPVVDGGAVDTDGTGGGGDGGSVGEGNSGLGLEGRELLGGSGLGRVSNGASGHNVFSWLYYE
jgi:hypothetical protein